MENILDYKLFESIKFVKQPKKKGAKTDIFNVNKL